MKRGFALLALYALLCGRPLPAAPGPGSRDWAQTAVDDLHFVRAVLRENHPGPVDSENPAFQDWYRRGFAKALERASRATDFAGYFFSINSYMAGFRDGHLGALVERHLKDHIAENRLSRRWPGFIVGFDTGTFTVYSSEGPGDSRPAAGDKLVACDGRPANDWAEDIIGDYVGLWFLPGERSLLGPLLLIDEGNPFVQMPRLCTFESASGRRTIPLRWAPIDGRELLAKLPAEGAETSPSLRRVGDSYWITVPTFNLSDAKSGAALKTLTERVRAEASAIGSARAVIFDVRGNRGGSSDAGKALLAAIWGETFVDERQPLPAAIDWRLSAGNVRFLRDSNLRSIQRQFGDSPQSRSYERLLVAMEAALARGEVFYHDVPEPAERSAEKVNVRARPILLTDNVCASACLDFADVVLRLPGAEHVGRETSADALYIDNRAVALPSGFGFFGFSMKVYRGRVRGNNEPYRPSRVWPGDIRDTAALEKWILEGR